MLGTTKSKLSTSLPSSASYSSSSSSSAYELRSRPDGMNSFRIRPRSRYRSKHSSLVSSHSTSLLGGQSIDEFIRSTRATSEKIVRHNDYNPYNEFLEEEHLRRQGASPVKNSSRDDCADNTGSGDEDGSREAMRRTRTAKRQSQIAVADRLSRPKSVHQSNNTPTSDSKMRASTLEKILQDNTH